MGRIIDMIESRRRKSPNPSSKPLYYSFEFFPPKTEAGLDNLLMRMDRMIGRLDPLFIDVTWGASGSTAARSLAVATHAQKFSGVQVLLHLTCAGMNRDQLLRTLEQSKANGIRNLLILRGDPPRSIQSWKPNDVSGGYCHRSIDLVRLVREVYGTYFCIAVAGHPEGHPSSISRKEEMKHLKEKITAGADFIITQFFYDCHSFFDFVLACREEGITCPILPGIMPIHSYSSFVRMTKYCNISVPKSLMNRLESVKDNDDAIKEIGIDLAVDMCQQLLQRPVEGGGVDGIHFYTLNLERSVTQILLGMQVIDVVVDRAAKDSTAGRRRGFSISDVKPIPSARALPWRPSALDERSKEEVRPINWANRPKSYVMRTETWDEFPNVSTNIYKTLLMQYLFI
jgi:methylenetetrahydrofolate reductase (NADPH)